MKLIITVNIAGEKQWKIAQTFTNESSDMFHKSNQSVKSHWKKNGWNGFVNNFFLAFLSKNYLKIIVDTHLKEQVMLRKLKEKKWSTWWTSH